MASPFGLKVDFFRNGFSLNPSSSLRKCHFNLSLLPKFSRSFLTLARSISLGVGQKLRPLDNRLISASLSSRLERLKTFLDTNLPVNLPSESRLL